jgi:hypothetical protein
MNRRFRQRHVAPALLSAALACGGALGCTQETTAPAGPPSTTAEANAPTEAPTEASAPGYGEAAVAPSTETAVDDGAANVAPAVVAEMEVGDGKVYLRIQEAAFDFWIATDPLEVAVGDHVRLGRGPERRNYRSEELDRQWPSMILIDDVRVVTPEESLDAARVAPAEGGMPIASLFAQREALAGQEVVMRGRIVRANFQIFGTNWYHIQDGTGGAELENHNLTFTSNIEATVGDIVTVRGSLTIDHDLGFGYFYSAILLDADATVESGGAP